MQFSFDEARAFLDIEAEDPKQLVSYFVMLRSLTTADYSILTQLLQSNDTKRYFLLSSVCLLIVWFNHVFRILAEVLITT